MTWLVTALVLVVLLSLYTSWTVGRLDRLHARVDAAWAGLDAAMARRAAAARAVVSHLPQGAPAAALERAVAAALQGGPVARESVENDLTQALRAALPALPDDEGARAARSELDRATTRVGLARSFHNSAVADTRAVRRRWFVRYLHLAGHRVVPLPFDIDDAVLRPS